MCAIEPRPYQVSRGTLKIPSCSKTVSAQNKSKFDSPSLIGNSKGSIERNIIKRDFFVLLLFNISTKMFAPKEIHERDVKQVFTPYRNISDI